MGKTFASAFTALGEALLDCLRALLRSLGIFALAGWLEKKLRK